MKTLNILIILILITGLNSFAQKNVEKETERFHIIDVNNDNSITLSEMLLYYNDKTNKDGSPKEANKLFYGLDANKDNRITLDEFTKKVDWKLMDQQIAERNKRLGISEEKPEENTEHVTIDTKKIARFNDIDTNNNDEISMSEMLEFNNSKINKAGKPVEADVIFYGLDTNDDSKLTLQEFVQKTNWKAGKQKKAMVIESEKIRIAEKTNTITNSGKDANFRKIDVNDDSKLSIEELIAYNKGRTDKQGEPINGAIIFYGLDNNEDGYVSREEFEGKVNWKLGKRKFKANRM